MRHDFLQFAVELLQDVWTVGVSGALLLLIKDRFDVLNPGTEFRKVIYIDIERLLVNLAELSKLVVVLNVHDRHRFSAEKKSAGVITVLLVQMGFQLGQNKLQNFIYSGLLVVARAWLISESNRANGLSDKLGRNWFEHRLVPKHVRIHLLSAGFRVHIATEIFTVMSGQEHKVVLVPTDNAGTLCGDGRNLSCRVDIKILTFSLLSHKRVDLLKLKADIGKSETSQDRPNLRLKVVTVQHGILLDKVIKVNNWSVCLSTKLSHI